MIVYTTPNTYVWTLCERLLKYPHLLIGGATGSGKSVLINSLMFTALSDSPAKKKFILIDPKRVELVQYKDVGDAILGYASEICDIEDNLDYAIGLMESRYEDMASRGLRMYDGSDIYVVIDEYADIVAQDRKGIERRIIRIAQLGRACRVHLIIATQRTTAQILNGTVKVNLDYRVALHCPTPQDSRNVIGQKGAEYLQIGQGMLMTPFGIEAIDIPMTPEDDISNIVKYWKEECLRANPPPKTFWEKVKDFFQRPD